MDHVEHLWLETSINGLLCAAFLKQLQEANTDARPYRRKITLKKLTIVGNKKSDIEQVFLLYLKTCHVTLRFAIFESEVQFT